MLKLDCVAFCAIQVNGKTLKFKRAVVATGGSAALPPIPGLKEAPYLTNASIFNLTMLPRRMVSWKNVRRHVKQGKTLSSVAI